MAHTFTSLLNHFVFSTKDRKPLVTKELKPALFSYMGGIMTQLTVKPMLINGPEDHVHILASLPPTISVSEFMNKLKTNSSGWVNKRGQITRFSWQTGYSGFSVSESSRNLVYQYIANQEKHHMKMSFQQELIGLLKKHRIEYDERYIWE